MGHGEGTFEEVEVEHFKLHMNMMYRVYMCMHMCMHMCSFSL